MGVLRTLWRTLLRQAASESSPAPEVHSPPRTIEALVDLESLVFSVQPNDLLESRLTAGVAEKYFDCYAARVGGTVAEVYGEIAPFEKAVENGCGNSYRYSFSLQGLTVTYTAFCSGRTLSLFDQRPQDNYVLYNCHFEIAQAFIDKEKAGIFLRKLLEYSNLNCRWDEDETGYLFLIFHHKGETERGVGVELLKELHVSLELTYEHGLTPRTVAPDYTIGAAIPYVKSSEN